ncbi:(2Fe-2S)-binding protein [Marinilabilia salmonicolor]|uniref:(2Fe-2S)-binding protein n=1 Tax=Marinilabilia salmonicolor TaxID=989 RepID=UPI000299F79A|nr:(2Fe-2S)-binding protein [Marinilabilia salmonicolor]
MSKLICICNRVSEEAIKKIVSRYPEATLQDIVNKTAASTSCGRCKTELQSVFERLKEQSSGNRQNVQLTLPFDFSGS